MLPGVKIRVGVVGVGNCLKSLLEGISYYTANPAEEAGLMHPLVGEYRISDIEIVAAFDIDSRKVGKPLHLAAESSPNHTAPLAAIPPSGIIVERGPTFDSVIPELRKYYIHESDHQAASVRQVLKKAEAEIVVNYLPTGSDDAARHYAEESLAAGCSFINCMPSPLAKDVALRERFLSRGLALLGDDIKCQCGVTILNRMLLNLCRMRGVKISKSDQFSYGGNADYFNLRYRAAAKEESNRAALGSAVREGDAPPETHLIFTEENYDHKRAVVQIHGSIFGGAPISISVTLDDEDSPNSGGSVVDAIRATKMLVNHKRPELGAMISAGLMKSPPIQLGEEEAHHQFGQILNSLGE